MGDTSLIFSIIARDKTTAVLKKLEAQASGVGKTVAMALGPAIAPIAAVSTVGIVSLGGAMASAGLAAGVFGAVAKSAMTEVSGNAAKVSDLTDKIKLYQTEIAHANEFGVDASKIQDSQAKAMLELRSRLLDLPPATRDATMAYIDMQAGWSSFVETNKPATFGIMTSGYKLLGSVISQLQPFFDQGTRAVKTLIAAVTPFITGGGIERFAMSSGPALETLTSIIINVGTALGRTFGKIGTGTGQGILNFIDTATAKWAAWAGTVGQHTGLDTFIAYAQKNGPQVIGLLTNLATAAMHIAQATSPIAPISLAIASALASMVAAIPTPWLTAIIAGFITFNLAMKAYALGTTIAKVATWAMNSALLASPITWIVLAVVALVAVIVLLATKTKFFQTIWNAVWGFMKTVGAWFAGPFAGFFVAWGAQLMASFKRVGDQVTAVGHAFVVAWNAVWGFLKGVGAWFAGPFAGFFVAWGNKLNASFGRVRSQVMSVVNFIKNYYVGMWNIFSSVVTKTINAGTRLVNWFRSAPGKLKNALGSMFSGLWSGFSGYVNKIIYAWNRLQFSIGGGSFMGISIPSFSVGTPDIPYMATGGKIRRDGMIYAHAGEEVVKKAQVTRTGAGTGTSSGGGATLTIKSDGGKVGRFVLEILREAIRDKGGDVIKVLTPG